VESVLEFLELLQVRQRLAEAVDCIHSFGYGFGELLKLGLVKIIRSKQTSAGDQSDV